MSGSFLLDTNIVIALFGGDALVKKRVATDSKFFIPCLVLGELYYGAQKSRRVNENMIKIKEFITSTKVLNCDSNTALEYAIIKNQLRKRGCPIPENDIWIAALAKQYNIALITRDKHFKEIKDVNVQTW